MNFFWGWVHITENTDKEKMWERSNVLKPLSPFWFTLTLLQTTLLDQAHTDFNCVRHMIQTKINKPSSWRLEPTAVISHSCSPRTNLLPTAELEVETGAIVIRVSLCVCVCLYMYSVCVSQKSLGHLKPRASSHAGTHGKVWSLDLIFDSQDEAQRSPWVCA